MLMMDWAKLIAIAMIAVFAATSAVQIAKAAAMDVQMSMPVDVGGGCPDCSDDTTTCSSVCVISSAALPATDFSSLRTFPLASPKPIRVVGLIEWRTPPDPFPPKRVS